MCSYLHGQPDIGCIQECLWIPLLQYPSISQLLYALLLKLHVTGIYPSHFQVQHLNTAGTVHSANAPQEHKGAEGHLVGSLLCLHLQATRNLLTGFTPPMTHLQGSAQILHFMRMLGLDCDSGYGSCVYTFWRFTACCEQRQEQWLIWFLSESSPWQTFSSSEVEGILKVIFIKKKKTGNLHWKKPEVWLATSFLTLLMAEWLQCIVLPFSAPVEQQFHPLKAKGYKNLY